MVHIFGVAGCTKALAYETQANPIRRVLCAFTVFWWGGEQGGGTVFQSGADIGNMRGADRRTNGIVANALLRQLFSGELSAGYDGMDHREMGKPSQVWCCKRGETIMRKQLSNNLRLFMHIRR